MVLIVTLILTALGANHVTVQDVYLHVPRGSRAAVVDSRTVGEGALPVAPTGPKADRY